MSWRETLAEHLAKEIGLETSTVGPAVLQLAVQHRMTALGLTDPDAYLPFLSREEESAALIEEIVIPESWFFRDAGAFARLRRFATEERPDIRMRILCVPCAAGEEAYSIASTLLSAGIPPERIHIDAVDLSHRAIAAARAGRYGSSAFRTPLPAAAEACFTGPPEDRQVSTAVRCLVHCRVGNILHRDLVQSSYDVIFCRNLLIYLTTAARRQVLEQLHQWLKPDGILFVGHSEIHVVNGSLFAADRDAASFALRPVKSLPEVALTTGAVEPSRQNGQRPPVLLDREVAPRPKPRTAAPPLAPRRARPALLVEAAARANQERYADALALCERALREQGPSAEAYFLQGMIALAQGETTRAEQLLERAVYLDANHDEALLALSLCAERHGRGESAQRYRQRAERAGLRRM